MYQRYTSRDDTAVVGAQDGICAIPVRAIWGPLGKVIKVTSMAQLVKTFGSADYGTGHTVPAAAELFRAGAATVYVYRLGTGGTAASKSIADGPTITAKHVGAVNLAVSIQAKVGDSSTKVFSVYFDNEVVEAFEFAADAEAEGANLVAAAAGSEYG